MTTTPPADALPGLIDLEDFFADPRFANPSLSPDGKPVGLRQFGRARPRPAPLRSPRSSTTFPPADLLVQHQQHDVLDDQRAGDDQRA